MRTFSVFIAIIYLFCLCENQTQSDICETAADSVSWEECIQILNSGCVESIMQAHSLDVYLLLDNDRQIKAKEPSIDLIFEEVSKCGEKCNGIVLGTE